ncbi:MAG: hypothetical protein PUJ51_24335 [Clostridiales bacterium]|uniref:hypothetical protein n=1 Tax=Terrisporobacter sp. TaxID=1965305 RepID=UPI002A503EA0|nr:hypothetical protein [Terrisporobacter sp.]MDD7757583.1 hypothetical protein [Clostridiales bacterium]MDY4135583.1 hypothetical protein [Terrisporobacter sp.]
MDYKKRCADCACLIEKNGVWCCDECFGQKCEEIDDCPEGATEETAEELDAKQKEIKVNVGARSEKKTERKPKTIKVSDEKTQIFNDLLRFLTENYDFSVLKDNKLIEISYNGKKFKLDLIETRQKKK